MYKVEKVIFEIWSMNYFGMQVERSLYFKTLPRHTMSTVSMEKPEYKCI